MSLASGKYLTKVEREVITWPAPDKDGDGSAVWIPQLDNEGREIGRVRAKDQWGNEVFEYKAPKGFQNRPGYDHSDNWVLVDARGDIVRQPNGEAVIIKPGQGLVFEPDGSVTVLADEYAQYRFGLAHDSVDTPEDVSDSSDVKSADADVSESKEDRVARLRAELAEAEAGN